MADELTSSLKDVVRSINERIKWHESEVSKLTYLRDAAIATMDGTVPVSPTRITGLQEGILKLVADKDAQTPGFTFTWIMLDEWLEHKWPASSISGALTELCKKGILEHVGMTEPIKPHGSKQKRQQRIFRVVENK